MSVIFGKGSKFLSFRYKWVDVPDLFYDWHVGVVLRNMKYKVDWMAIVDPSQPIDLDAVKKMYIKDMPWLKTGERISLMTIERINLCSR